MAATRREAREWAIQMLTAADLNPPENLETYIASLLEEIGTIEKDEGGPGKEPSGRYRRFATERVVGVLSTKDELDAILTPLLDRWELSRLGTVERAVLRLGVWEMKYAEVPAPVAINEAVDIVNWFSSPRSRPMINAVLDKYAKSVKNDG